MPLMRYQTTSNLDKGETQQLFRITLNAGSGTDDLAGAGQSSILNTQYVTTNKPLVIYQYECTTIFGGAAGVMFQYYGDDDDVNQLGSWDLSNLSFQEGLKNKVFMGAQPSVSHTANANNPAQPAFKVYKMKFKARKNPRRMWAKFGKWAVKPIVLSPHTKNSFGFSLTNLMTGDAAGSFDDQRAYSIVELKRWQTEF